MGKRALRKAAGAHPLKKEGGVEAHIAAAARALERLPRGQTLSTARFCRQLVLAQQMQLPDFSVGMSQLLRWPRLAKAAVGEAVWMRRVVPAAPTPPPPLPPFPKPREAPPPLPAVDAIVSRLQAALTAEACAALREAGGVVLPRALLPEEAAGLLHALGEEGAVGRPTHLRESQGNGRLGAYHQLLRTPPALAAVAEGAASVLAARGFEVKARGKHLLLRYGEGGVNYAHQDHTGFPYQCALMLSTPGSDFTGGDTYTIDACSRRATELRYASAGDLAVFASSEQATGKHLYHGMRRVERGSAAECHRFAIGLFQ
ncbi:hypothetical protein AB1Y20_020963 [Prymnesium parvum]|uniref:Fe2OG dioxygenase domain-containing protein n=1 Tax=Prymnesium parvum TaxID=97485 RepID=A0AB34JHD4_PRYPA